MNPGVIREGDYVWWRGSRCAFLVDAIEADMECAWIVDEDNGDMYWARMDDLERVTELDEF